MQSKINKIFMWLSIAGLLGLSLVIRIFGAQWVAVLYQNAPDVLNQILKIHPESLLPLDFYIGKMEDVLLGPGSVLASGLAFLIFALCYLKTASGKIFGMAVFFYLLLAKFEVLFFPPYGDAIGGPFVEAIWLARHSFDYAGLARQSDYIHGGPRVYLFSLYPSYLALLIKLIPNTKLFLLINHLIVFAGGAVVVSLFRNILLKVFDEKISILTSVLFLSLPLFQSQVEAINMEIPVLLFSMTAIYFLINRNILMASVMSIIAAMVKGYGILVCGTVFFGSLLLFGTQGEYRFKIKPLLWGALAVLFIPSQTLISFMAFSGEEGQVDMVGLFSGWPSIKVIKLSYIYLASVVVVLVVLLSRFIIAKFIRRQKMDKPAQSVIYRYFPVIIMFVCAAAWFGLFINSFAVSPRYRLLAYPFVVFSAFFAFSMIIKKDLIRQGSLIAGICFACVSSYGLPQAAVHNKNHVILERSLEYRNDLKVNMRAAKELEENFSSFTIAAPFIYAQFLGLPEMGYVSRKYDVMIYGMPCTYGDIRNFNGLSELNIFRTIWVGIDEGDMDYPVNPGDKVVKKVIVGDREVFLFMGGKSIEMRRLAIGLYGYFQNLE